MSSANCNLWLSMTALEICRFFFFFPIVRDLAVLYTSNPCIHAFSCRLCDDVLVLLN